MTATMTSTPVPTTALLAEPFQPSDEDILTAIARGEHTAFAQLYDRYSRLALAVAYRVLNDHGTAEDAVQTAFLSVWNRA